MFIVKTGRKQSSSLEEHEGRERQQACGRADDALGGGGRVLLALGLGLVDGGQLGRQRLESLVVLEIFVVLAPSTILLTLLMNGVHTYFSSHSFEASILSGEHCCTAGSSPTAVQRPMQVVLPYSLLQLPRMKSG